MNKTQCKMARAALGWRAQDLADAANVHRITVARFEAGDDIADDSAKALQGALEAQGVKFGRKAGRSSVSVPDGA
ncbi:helix-turn-helix domain-containing protein [Parasphingorhabdus sp.]|uniref:helix-turn-helix domain-containing protein n=1 Tax=Parasphingorhabdus sp. TaxID=2709688 RepID=UPI003A93D595